MSDTEPYLIHQQMVRIMAEVAPIAKARRNAAQGYSFRGIDDVYQALQAIMAKHGVYSLPTVLEERTEDRQTKGGGALIYRVLKIRYDFYATDGSFVEATVIGEGMDSGDKASNKAMSVADKYCLLQAFKIPTEEPKDPENDSPEPVAKRYVPAPAADAPEVYDARNKAHNNALAAKLKEMGINPDDNKAIAAIMHGRPRTAEALVEALDAFRRPPPDDGVPF